MIKIVSKEIPHAYRNKYLRASGNTVVISGGTNTGGNTAGGSGSGDIDTSVFAQRDEDNTFTKDNTFKGGIVMDNPAPSLVIKRNSVQVAALGYDVSKSCVSLSSTEANKGLNLYDDGRFEFGEYAVYHAGNSNLSTVDWKAKALFSNVLKAANQTELVKYDGTNTVLGALAGTTTIQSKAADLLHSKGGANYLLWDASNSNLNTVDWKARSIFAKDHVQNENFISGYTGSGCRISADGKAECTDLWVRGTMNVYELIVNKINATNGALAVSDNGKVASVTGSTLTLTGDNDNMNTFRAGDVLKCQRFTGKNVKLYFLTVTAVAGLTVTFTYRSGGSGANTVAPGDVLVRWNSSDANRKGLLYLTASDSQAPYMDVLYNEQVRLRLGRLDGIVDSAFPTGTQPNGFGMYSQNAFLKGVFVLTSGKTVDGEITAASNKASAAQTTANNAQTAANGAKSAADAAQSTANTAKTNAQTANTLLTDIANDNKLTAQEKQQAKKEWDIIVSEKSKNDASADKYSVSKTAYTTAYNTLNSYITPLLASLTATSNITGSDFRAKFKAYYDARTDLLNAISAKAKALADTAQTTANNAQTAANNANNAITGIRTELSAVDGKITLAVNETKTYTNNAINNLQIGGKNYFGFKKGVAINIHTNTSVFFDTSINGIKIVTTSTTTSGSIICRLSNLKLPYNGKYSFSADISASSNCTISHIDICDATVISNIALTTTAKRIAGSTNVNQHTGSPYYGFCDIEASNLASGITIYIKNLKIEEGNKATDWTPAPEDITQDAQDKANAALNAAKTYTNSEITVVNGKINLKVDSSTFNALGNRVSSCESRITQTENSIKLKADQTTVNGINTRLQSAEAKITPDAIKLTVKDQATTIADNAANNIQIGGTNLIPNSARLPNFAWVGGFIASVNSYKVQAFNSKFENIFRCTKVGNGFYISAVEPSLISGKKYTWSFYAKMNVSRTLSTVGHEQGGAKACVFTTGWQKFTHTFTANNNQYHQFVFYSGWQLNDELHIHSLKLEEGTKPTDWSPSPFDKTEIGNKNYFSEAKSVIESGNSPKFESDNYKITLTVPGAGAGSLMRIRNLLLDGPGDYTVSFNISSNKSFEMAMDVCDVGRVTGINIGTATQKIVRTFYNINQYLNSPYYGFFDMDCGSNTQAGTVITISHFKIEKGTVATGWDKSPLDYSTTNQIKSQFTMDASGISILGKKIAFTGVVTFNALASDAQNKINAAQTAANNAQSTANTARTEKIEMARLGTTVISGGYIKTSLINTDELVAKKVTAATGTFNSLSTTGGTMTLDGAGVTFSQNSAGIIAGLGISSGTIAPSTGLSVPIGSVRTATNQYGTGNMAAYFSAKNARGGDSGGYYGNCAILMGYGSIYGFKLKLRRINTATTLDSTDVMIITTASNDINITMPNMGSTEQERINNDGRFIMIGKRGSGNIYVYCGRRYDGWRGFTTGSLKIDNTNHYTFVYDGVNNAWDCFRWGD